MHDKGYKKYKDIEMSKMRMVHWLIAALTILSSDTAMNHDMNNWIRISEYASLDLAAHRDKSV